MKNMKNMICSHCKAEWKLPVGTKTSPDSIQSSKRKSGKS